VVTKNAISCIVARNSQLGRQGMVSISRWNKKGDITLSVSGTVGRNQRYLGGKDGGMGIFVDHGDGTFMISLSAKEIEEIRWLVTPL
jgi:hypothetical protein